MTEPDVESRLVQVSEFKLWPGVIVDDPQTASAEYVLDAVSDFVRSESGDPDRWPDPAGAPRAVRRIVVQVAARIWTNPSGASLSVTGPFTESFAQTVDEGMHLTDAEQATLKKATRRSPLSTISTTRDYDGTWTGYDRFSGERVPSAPYPFDALYGGPL